MSFVPNFSESFLVFLANSNNRIAKVLFSAKYDHKSTWNAYSLMFTDSINHLTFRNDGTISFLPKGKEHLTNSDGTWKIENRQNGKPGKVIRKLFTDKALKLFKDSDFEVFGNQYKSHFADGLKLVLEPNNKISDVYRMHYSDGEGTLNNSCMRNEDREYFDIYTNCKDLSILALYDKESNLSGRALVWNCQFKGQDITFMDRVYTAKEYQCEMFFEYATKNGWYRKQEQSYSNKTGLIAPDGTFTSGMLSIDLDTEHSNYPYIDTFSYGEYGSLNNYSGTYDYTNTDGTRSGEIEEEEEDNSVWDCIDECSIDEDEACMIERGRFRNNYTHTDNTCEVDGYTYWTQDDDIIYLESTGEYHFRDEVTYCENNYEYYPSDDCVYSEFDECDYLRSDCTETEQGWVLDCDAVEVEGVWYHKDEVPEIEEDEEEEVTAIAA